MSEVLRPSLETTPSLWPTFQPSSTGGGYFLGLLGIQDGPAPGDQIEARVAALFGPFVVLLGERSAPMRR